MTTIHIGGVRDPDAETGHNISIDGSVQPQIDGLQAEIDALDGRVTVLEAGVDAGDGGPGGFCSVNPDGIVLDGVTDATDGLQAELNRIAGLGGGTLKLISGMGVRVDGQVDIGSEITLDLSECPVIYGARGALRLNGEVKQVPVAGRPYLFADVAAGDTVFSIVVHDGNVTPAAHQQFMVRGAHTALGSVVDEFQSSIVSAVNHGPVAGGVKWTITSADPFDADYALDYPGSGYAALNGGHDYSTFAVNVFSRFTADVTAGAMVVPVEDGAVFTVGDYVFVNDLETAGVAVGSADANPIHQEMNRVVGIDGNTVKLARALSHDYTTAWSGGLCVWLPVRNSQIVGARVRFAENGDAKASSLVMNRAVNCRLSDCTVEAVWTGTQWLSNLKNAVRIDRSWQCFVSRCRVVGRGGAEDAFTGSGRGYGFVLQGCTDCHVSDCHSENCRHGVLIQAGASGNVVGQHVDINARISGIDLHGLNARQNRVHDCQIHGGPSNASDATVKAAVRVGNSAHVYGDFDNVIEGISIYGYGGFPVRDSDGAAVTGVGLSLVTRSGGNLFRSIVVDGADYGISAMETTGDVLHHAALKGNSFEAVTVRGAQVATWQVDGGTYSVWPELNFRNVVSDGNARHFEISRVGKARITGCRIVNPVAAAGRYAVKAVGVGALRVVNNEFDSVNRGASIQSCPGAQITSNTLSNMVESVVFKDDTSSGNSNGYIFQGNRYPGVAAPTVSLGASTGYTLQHPKKLDSYDFTEAVQYLGLVDDATGATGMSATITAVQAFVAGQGGGYITFGEGTRRIDAQVRFVTGVWMTGSEGVTFKRDPTFHGIMFGQTSTDAHGIHSCGLLGKMVIDGNRQDYTITGLTRSGGTATAVLASTASLINGGIYAIIGADQPEYNSDYASNNVSKIITVVDGTHITFSVPGAPVTPATTATGIKLSDDFYTIRFDDDTDASYDISFNAKVINFSRTHSSLSCSGITRVFSDYFWQEDGGSPFIHGVYSIGCADVRAGEWTGNRNLGNAFKVSGATLGHAGLYIDYLDVDTATRGLHLVDFDDVVVAAHSIKDCDYAITINTEQTSCNRVYIGPGDIIRSGSLVYTTGVPSSAQGAVTIDSPGRMITLENITFHDCPCGLYLKNAMLVRCNMLKFDGTGFPLASVTRSGTTLKVTLASDGTSSNGGFGGPLYTDMAEGVSFLISGLQSEYNIPHVFTRSPSVNDPDGVLTYVTTVSGSISSTPTGTPRLARVGDYIDVWIKETGNPTAVFTNCDFRVRDNGATYREYFRSEVTTPGAISFNTSNKISPSSTGANAWSSLLTSSARVDGYLPTRGAVLSRTTSTNFTLTWETSAPYQRLTGTFTSNITVTLSTTNIGPDTEWHIVNAGSTGNDSHVTIAGSGMTSFVLPIGYGCRVKWDDDASVYLLFSYCLQGGRDNAAATAAPRATDDSASGYVVGSVWLWAAKGRCWRCRDATPNAARWVEIAEARHPGYIVGNWYATFNGVVAGSARATGTISFVPFVIESRVTISDMGARVTTLAASGNFSLAIYSHNPTTGRPTGNPLAATGNISTTSAVSASGAITGGNVTLEPGICWAAYMVDATAGGVAAINLVNAASHPTWYMIGSATLGNITNSLMSVLMTHTYGSPTWPDVTSANFTESTNVSNNGPALAFKVA